MISICRYFLENANVGPSTLVIAPFGVIDPSERSKKILAKAQNLNMKEPDEQTRWMKKVLK